MMKGDAWVAACCLALTLEAPIQQNVWLHHGPWKGPMLPSRYSADLQCRVRRCTIPYEARMQACARYRRHARLATAVAVFASKRPALTCAATHPGTGSARALIVRWDLRVHGLCSLYYCARPWHHGHGLSYSVWELYDRSCTIGVRALPTAHRYTATGSRMLATLRHTSLTGAARLALPLALPRKLRRCPYLYRHFRLQLRFQQQTLNHVHATLLQRSAPGASRAVPGPTYR